MSEDQTLWVAGMCCGKCRDRLTTALSVVAGVERVWVERPGTGAAGRRLRGVLSAPGQGAGLLTPLPE